MINYSFKRSDNKNRIKEIIRAKTLQQFSLAILCFIGTTYFLTIGFILDKEALLMGYSLLFLFIAILIHIIITIRKIRFVLESIFKKQPDKEEINYTIKKEHGNIYIECLDTKLIASFLPAQIKKITYTQSCFLLELIDDGIIVFPKQPELLEFFSQDIEKTNIV